MDRPAPVVIGHRGACAWVPEHTLASYARALDDGADHIEPDLVATKDGALLIRHENNIADTTDVASRAAFAGRRTEKLIDGQRHVGWFTEDFTLAELRTLRAVERLPQLRPASAAQDGRYPLVTWEEMIDFAAAESRRRGHPIGLIPEIKHSTYHAAIGLAMEERVIASVARSAYARTCPLVVQSFEVGNLRHLRGRIPNPNASLMQLATSGADAHPADTKLSYAAMMTPAGLAEVATYADILAPDTRALIPLGPDRRLRPPSTVIEAAHAAGLLVMPYTFRPENQFLPADWQDGEPIARNEAGSRAEIGAFLRAGIDGFFTDDPALGRAAVDSFRAP